MHYRHAIVWQKAVLLAEACCRLAVSLPPAERYGLRPQMTRSAISVASNIAEGWTRESRREKAQFLAVAHGSLAEVYTQLLIAVRLEWIADADASPAFGIADEISRILTALRRQLRA